MELFKLFGSIFVDNDKANESIAKTEDKAQKLATQFTNGVKTVGKWGAAIAGASVAVGGALLGVANSSAEASKEIEKMSSMIGFSKTAYQEWDFIAKQTGTSMEQLQGGITDLAEKMQDASTGTGEASEIFKALGVNVVDANGNLRDSQSVFEETILALQGMENATDRQAYATKLMSTTGEELLPLLNGQIGSIDELKNKAHDLGLVMSDEAVASGAEFNDTMTTLKSTFGLVGTVVGNELIPIFQGMADWAIENVPLVIDKFKEFKDMIGLAIDYVKGIDDWLKDNQSTIELVAIAVGTLTAAIIAFNGATILETAQIYGLIVAEKLHAIVTAASTVATTAFGAAMAFLTSPITLVILAIGALIAIGVTLYKNWDTIKEKATSIWNGILDSIKKPMEKAKNFVKGIIDTIKGFFNFKISFPKIPMPHFSVKPKGWSIGDLLKGKIPSLGIDWYAKAMDDGMILDSPTIFGMQNGKLLGGGEAGSEVVVGKNSLLDMIQQATSQSNNGLAQILIKIYERISDEDKLHRILVKALTDGNFRVELDGREVGRIVKAYA